MDGSPENIPSTLEQSKFAIGMGLYNRSGVWCGTVVNVSQIEGWVVFNVALPDGEPFTFFDPLSKGWTVR